MNNKQTKELAIGKLKNDMEREKREAMSRWGVDSEMFNREAFVHIIDGLEPLTELEQQMVDNARADMERIEAKYAGLIQEVASDNRI